ncbi:FAD-binding oxidoreductase [Candidatus Pacearchaeota archaeon]|nr:FAD-binding oxidoreductase [Candidatus Pacearchaeota archaeon]
MLYENWLQTASLNIKTAYCPPLKRDVTSDCLVIGGGIAGLHAAFRLANAGKEVILLEKTMCGGSSSGQSGGFLTPESEEDIKKLIKRYGRKRAGIIYNIPLSGVNMIVSTIKDYNFNCDLRKQDSLYLSIKPSHNDKIEEEAETRKEMNLPYELLDKNELEKIHPGGYILGLKYSGSYGMNSLSYVKEMKNLLLKKGVKIYESSEVNTIEGNTVKTHLGSVKADNIILCIDKMKKEIHQEVSKKYYHVQTFLSISEPLTNEEMNTLFPKQEVMCWDTKWNYTHYRPVVGNRILIGGSSVLTSYYSKYYHSPTIINRSINQLKKRFPIIKDAKFTHYWAGLIDVTKDLVPIVDYDNKNKSMQYVMGCAGLNWAAFCGDYAARRILDPKNTEDLTEFLGLNRKYFLPDFFQNIFGKKITFAISHIRELIR